MVTEQRIRAITNSDSVLSDQLELAFCDAHSIDIIVSFVKHSGVRVMRPLLYDLLKDGVRVRMLTSTYLGITDPFALEMLFHLREMGAQVRIFNDDGRSFHPKSYIVHRKDGTVEAFIGSSNISRSALVDGVEWNYRLDSRMDPDSVRTFCDEFNRLFGRMSMDLTEDVLLTYRDSWKRPVLSGDVRVDDTFVDRYEPTGAQQIALDSLASTREQGNDRALVVMATGTGKTVLAALDSRGFDSVLFIAHRKEILRQAMDTFVSVRGLDPSRDCGFFYGDVKEPGRRFLFASIGTLSKEVHLRGLDVEGYDYVVVDEFHHAAAKGYRRILDRLRPRFLLGLTATPDRMDSEDVRVLCNDNVPFEMGMPDAIRFGYLVPFVYWGIYDGSVDYDKVRMSKGRYDADDLARKYRNAKKRNDLILKNYRLRAGDRTLAFCANRMHAKDMRDYFMENGIESRMIVSSSVDDGIISDDRVGSVEELINGDVGIIFTVDVFNEGVDIPQVDTVMFLRPTDSHTVFLQQLGRGLRLSHGKDRLIAIDFIGNYLNADRIPTWLTGRKYEFVGPCRIRGLAPPGCSLNFDMESIDIIELMHRRNTGLRDLIKEQYTMSKTKRGHRPSRLEFLEDFDQEFVSTIRNRPISPFKDYLHFIEEMGDLTPIERTFLGRETAELFRVMETTPFNRMYKAVLLYSLYDGGRMKMSSTTDHIMDTFREFYSREENRFDIEHLGPIERITRRKWEGVISQPRQHLNDDENGFFIESGERFSLDPMFSDVISCKEFIEHFRDILDYRTEDFRRFRKRTPAVDTDRH